MHHLSDYLDKCIQDAFQAFDALPGLEILYPKLYPHDFSIYMWPQTWGSTTCGYGGIGGQAMTTSYIVVIDAPNRGVRVYNNRFAFALKEPNDKFWEDFKNRSIKMMGWSKYERG